MNSMDNPCSLLSHTPLFAQMESGGGGGMQILILGLMLAGMWFLLIAPQRKRQKKQQAMIDALSTGDEILTIGGIYGSITNIKQDRLVVRIADNTKVEILRSAVQSKVEKSAN